MERTILLALIIFDGLLVAVGQFFIKTGMLRVAQAVPSPFSHLGRAVTEMARTPHIWVGLVLSGICFLLWALILAKAPLMVAGPVMNAAFYLALVAISVWLLGEHLSLTKGAGVAVLLFAIILLSREPF